MKYFKSYPIESTAEIPVIIGRTKGIEPGSVILHNHPGIEINLLLKGSAQYLIGGKNFLCKEGDIVVIGEGEVHRAWNADDAVFLVVIFRQELLISEQVTGYEQKFMAPYWAVGHGVSPILGPSTPYYQKLVDDLLAIEAEVQDRTNSYRLMIKALLLSFSATLSRSFQIADDSPLLDRGNRSRRFALLKDYIEERYSEKILVADMADQVHMSVTNFTRSFKAVFGKTPLDYLMQTRIRHAAQMLLAGDRKVIDIANDCGFPSISHFITCFRRITGVAPHVYRKQQHLTEL